MLFVLHNFGSIWSIEVNSDLLASVCFLRAALLCFERLSIMFLICIAIVVGLIAWLMIPRKPSGPKPPEAGPPPVAAWPSPTPVGPTGPFQASVDEKMAVIATELRKRQTDKYRNQVIDEVADLVTAKNEERRTKN